MKNLIGTHDERLLNELYAIFQCDTAYSKGLVLKLYSTSKELTLLRRGLVKLTKQYKDFVEIPKLKQLLKEGTV